MFFITDVEGVYSAVRAFLRSIRSTYKISSCLVFGEHQTTAYFVRWLNWQRKRLHLLYLKTHFVSRNKHPSTGFAGALSMPLECTYITKFCNTNTCHLYQRLVLRQFVTAMDRLPNWDTRRFPADFHNCYHQRDAITRHVQVVTYISSFPQKNDLPPPHAKRHGKQGGGGCKATDPPPPTLPKFKFKTHSLQTRWY